MRKGLAGFVLGLALVVASVSWAGFILSRTILDPGRSERLADQVFENDVLRSVLVSRIAAGAGATLPADVVVPTQTLEAGADLALDNPAIQALIRQGIVDTHRAALEGQVEPVTIDGAALGQALRDSLVQTNPALDGILPAAPVLTVELPTAGLNILGLLKDFVDRFTILTGAVALIGGAIALVVTNDRPSVLRRVALWAFGASLFWLIVGFGVPWLAGLVGPASSALITAMVDVFFGAMIPPAVAMGVVGLALLAISFFWASLSVRRPANVAQPARVARGQGSKASATRIAGVQVPQPVPQPARPVPSRAADQTVVQPLPQQRPSSTTRPTAVPGPNSNSPTGQFAATPNSAFPASPETDPWAPDEPTGSSWFSDEDDPSGKGWVEGVGYVDEPPS